MKLAEALAERSDCQVRLEELKKRVLRSARVQEGETAAQLLAEVDRLFAQLLELVSGIGFYLNNVLRMTQRSGSWILL